MGGAQAGPPWTPRPPPKGRGHGHEHGRADAMHNAHSVCKPAACCPQRQPIALANNALQPQLIQTLAPSLPGRVRDSVHTPCPGNCHPATHARTQKRHPCIHGLAICSAVTFAGLHNPAPGPYIARAPSFHASVHEATPAHGSSSSSVHTHCAHSNPPQRRPQHWFSAAAVTWQHAKLGGCLPPNERPLSRRCRLQLLLCCAVRTCQRAAPTRSLFG